MKGRVKHTTTGRAGMLLGLRNSQNQEIKILRSEMQIKATMRGTTSTSPERPSLKSLHITNAGDGVEKRNCPTLLGRMQPPTENRIEVPELP